ncbi:ribonuclease H-like domain-containing protein [Rhizophagus clarus]|uniref:Ribonuclease H-like domain-containing protein n=1 Tax=Rhizophagus clarus TaxID=94130 RepID=A0A8H3LPY8_9GLOM|nr:ribonuclease H-like domain-containing protein [Rhizophagus clarus]
MTDNSFNDDSFVRNPPIPLDIEQFSLQDSLFSSKSSSPPLSNSFNISSFNINVFSSPLDTSQHVRSSGGVSLFVENSLASHVHTYTSLSSRLLAVDLYFKGNVKLRIFVVYIPPTSDQALRDITIDLLIQALSEAKRLGFHHAICGDFNMHLDQFYLVFFNQPQMASKRIHRLFNFLLSNGYVDYTPINSSVSLGTFSRADIITRIDYIWSCPLLKSFLLTSYIFDGYSVSPALWDDFSAHVDTLCNISPSTFATWHINRMCEYLHSSIITGANAVLPSRTIGNDHIPKLPKDLETLLQHYRFLGRVLHSIRILRKHPHTLSSSHDHKWSVYLIRLNNIFRLYKSCFLTTPVLPPTLSSCRADNFKCVYDTLSRSSHLLRGLHLLKKKEYQESSIRSHIEQRDQNFDTDISSFIDSALSRSRQRIVLDRVFIDHPSTSRLLTDPSDISDAVVNHFQHAVPVKATSPSTISALPDRWHSEYLPMDSISPSIYDSLLSPPSLDEWLTVISSMPNGKAMITYEMLKHLSPTTNALLLILICKCFASADIPDLWRQAMEMLDPYILRSPSLLSSSPGDTANLAINNLVFMDDSTLISSTKTGLEHMLSIMEEFYALNNTSANHQKYVLISNSLSLTTTSTLSPVEFNLSLSSLNNVSSISVTPISITSSFQFLGVWFNIKGSHDFVKKQIAGECNSFTATLRPAKLSAKQVVYLPKVFKACLKVLRKYHLYYLSQLITPTGSHLISWTVYRTAYIAQLADKRGHSLPHKWYLDIQAATTIPDSHDRLYNRYVCSPSAVPAVSLVPGATTNQKNRRWLVTLDNNAAPLFGKQLSVQSKKDTCVIVHWISDCLSSPGDVIRLRSCPGCDAHVPFPSATKYTAVTPQCTFTISLLRSLILPTDCDRIQQSTTDVISSHSWADIQDLMISYYNRLSISPDFSSSSSDPRDDLDGSLLSRDLLGLPSPVVLPPGSHYRFYTDGSLINLSSPDVSMGWSWVQIIHDAGFLNSVASYAHGTIRNWPSSSRAEAAAIFTALSITPHDSVVSIYTDSQVAIDGLRSCVSSTYTNSRSYYKTTNFELWASIECSIRQRRLTVLSVKVKGHDGNYWNEFADSLANSAHHSDDAVLLPIATLASLHNVRLIYDEVICESNPRRLIKTYFQATYMQDLLSLKRFQFIFCLGDRDDYVVDWDLTWFTLNYSPVHDASFQAHHASRYYTFKFKLFLDELPLLEKLKITCPDLYIDLLTC